MYIKFCIINLLHFLEPSSSILATIKKKKDAELLNESHDMDRDFNPFQKKLGGQTNISISTPSSLDQVINLINVFILNNTNYIMFFLTC